MLYWDGKIWPLGEEESEVSDHQKVSEESEVSDDQMFKEYRSRWTFSFHRLYCTLADWTSETSETSDSSVTFLGKKQ